MRDKALEIGLLIIRVTVFVAVLMWTLDKFINPVHAAHVYQHFYFIGGLGHSIVYIIGAVELLILLGFVLGAFKTVTYGLVLVFHSVSTFAAWKVYLSPYQDLHLLFFAAWPMWAACLTLFLLRDRDRLLALSKG